MGTNQEGTKSNKGAYSRKGVESVCLAITHYLLYPDEIQLVFL